MSTKLCYTLRAVFSKSIELILTSSSAFSIYTNQQWYHKWSTQSKSQDIGNVYYHGTLHELFSYECADATEKVEYISHQPQKCKHPRTSMGIQFSNRLRNEYTILFMNGLRSGHIVGRMLAKWALATGTRAVLSAICLSRNHKTCHQFHTSLVATFPFRPSNVVILG